VVHKLVITVRASDREAVFLLVESLVGLGDLLLDPVPIFDRNVSFGNGRRSIEGFFRFTAVLGRLFDP